MDSQDTGSLTAIIAALGIFFLFFFLLRKKIEKTLRKNTKKNEKFKNSRVNSLFCYLFKNFLVFRNLVEILKPTLSGAVKSRNLLKTPPILLII